MKFMMPFDPGELNCATYLYQRIKTSYGTFVLSDLNIEEAL